MPDEDAQPLPVLAQVALLACLCAFVMPLIGLGMAGGPNDHTAAWLLFSSPAIAVAGMACAWAAATRAARAGDRRALGFTKAVFVLGLADLGVFLLVLVAALSAASHMA